jgi:asparagine synthase (glutamine-hydrolysing)
MCGIVGTYPNQDEFAVKKGIIKLRHRGPDEEGCIKTSNGALGHTRLSIIDVEKGRQPMRHNESWIVFNGEVYNYQKLKRMLPVSQRTASDTEIVLQLYNYLGPECVSLLDGMFAFAITDGSSLFLARDPLGIKPLYYVIVKDTLYFASEMKALFSVSNEIKEFPAGHWWHSEFGLKKY